MFIFLCQASTATQMPGTPDSKSLLDISTQCASRTSNFRGPKQTHNSLSKPAPMPLPNPHGSHPIVPDGKLEATLGSSSQRPVNSAWLSEESPSFHAPCPALDWASLLHLYTCCFYLENPSNINLCLWHTLSSDDHLDPSWVHSSVSSLEWSFLTWSTVPQVGREVCLLLWWPTIYNPHVFLWLFGLFVYLTFSPSLLWAPCDQVLCSSLCLTS